MGQSIIPAAPTPTAATSGYGPQVFDDRQDALDEIVLVLRCGCCRLAENPAVGGRRRRRSWCRRCRRRRRTYLLPRPQADREVMAALFAERGGRGDATRSPESYASRSLSAGHPAAADAAGLDRP